MLELVESLLVLSGKNETMILQKNKEKTQLGVSGEECRQKQPSSGWRKGLCDRCRGRESCSADFVEHQAFWLQFTLTIPPPPSPTPLPSPLDLCIAFSALVNPESP